MIPHNHFTNGSQNRVAIVGAKEEIWHHRQQDSFIKALMLFKTCGFSHSSVMLRREVYQQFRYSDQYPHTEDMELFLNIALNSNWQFANIPEVLLQYRVHQEQVSEQFKSTQNQCFFELIYLYIKQIIPEVQKEELYIHWDICNATPAKTRDDLIQKGKWLNRLHKALFTRGKDQYFVIQEKWLNYCLLNNEQINSKSLYHTAFDTSHFCFAAEQYLS